MNLYLLQHGEAALENVDPSRPLTLKGKNDLLKIAGFMRQAGVKIDEIWHSTKLRAKQTAEIMAKELSLNKVVEREGLKPNDPIGLVREEIEKDHRSALISSHLPFLQKLVSSLLIETEDKEMLKFTPGTVVFLERGGFGWQVVWMISPEVI